MEKVINKSYLYKFTYAIIMFLSILSLPFLFLSFENEYNEVLDKYNDAVTYAISEEFSTSSKNQVLELLDKVEEAKIVQNYKIFVSLIIVIIFVILFNYFHLRYGLKHSIINESVSINLNKLLLMIVGIVEIIYLVVLLLFTNLHYIGINFWTLFFINLIMVVLCVVIFLQLQFILKPKQKGRC